MYINTDISIKLYKYICVCTCTNVYVYVHMYVFIYTHIHGDVYVHIYICTCICTYAICTCACTYEYMRAEVYIYVRTYVYAYTHRCDFRSHGVPSPQVGMFMRRNSASHGKPIWPPATSPHARERRLLLFQCLHVVHLEIGLRQSHNAYNGRIQEGDTLVLALPPPPPSTLPP